MTKKSVDDLNTLQGRIAFLKDKLKRGSQTEMAAFLKVSQGTIANVLAGRRKPGRAFLSGLVAHPLVNEQWLMEGLGFPLLVEQTESLGETVLPITQRLFSGHPDENPESLADVLYPVPRRLYRRSRYWIHVDGSHHPFASDPDQIRSGDWVLMEPDSQNWPDDLQDKYCVVNVTLPDRKLLLYGRVRAGVAGAFTTHDFHFWGQHPEEIEDYDALFQDGQQLLAIDVSSSQAAKTENTKKLPADVVAIAIHRCGDL